MHINGLQPLTSVLVEAAPWQSACTIAAVCVLPRFDAEGNGHAKNGACGVRSALNSTHEEAGRTSPVFLSGRVVFRASETLAIPLKHEPAGPGGSTVPVVKQKVPHG